MNITLKKIAFVIATISTVFLASCADSDSSVSAKDLDESSSSISESSSSEKGESSSSESVKSSSSTAKSSSSEDEVSSSSESSSSKEESSSSEDAVSSSSEEISSSSEVFVFGVENCGDLWCGPAKDATLKNVADGSWHSTTGAYEGTIIWDAEVSDTPVCENCIEHLLDFTTEVNELGAIQGTATFDNSFRAGVIWMFANLNKEGMDISDWGGLCIAYESNEAFKIGLGAKTDENNLFYSILKKTNNNTSVLDLPWSTFKKISNTDGSIIAASKEATYIEFVFDAVTPENYGYNPYVAVDEIKFKILTFGKMGSCKGAVTAEDPAMCGVRPYNPEKFTCDEKDHLIEK